MQILNPSSPEYPVLLQSVPDKPHTLYTLGSTALLSSLSISVVGSRKMTPYGEEVLKQLIPGLVSAGLTIVSGLAYGVDSFAHTVALEEKGKCVAVLGGGFDRLYPARHRGLFEKIQTSGGCVVSEYAPEVSPTAYSFPARNRIIAGLSQATLIVEAGETSGTLSTARFARDYGRQVCVVPADITRKSSQGVLNLLKEGSVYPVSTVADILSCYQLELPIVAEEPFRPALTGSAATLYDCILRGTTTLDGFMGHTGWAINRVQSVLSVLELDGYIAFRDYQWQKIS
jgi:DNA processing protein